MVAAEAERKRKEAIVNAVHPLESLGGARYVGGFGFLLPSSSSDPAPPEGAAAEPPLIAPPSKSLGRADWQLGLDVSYVHWTDPTGNAAFDLGAAAVGVWLRPEFRAIGRWVTPWVDVRANAAMAVGAPMTATDYGGSGHLGIDVQPLNFFGIGPFAGYRIDYFTVSQQGGSSQSWNSTDSGLDLGLHARLRTLEAPDRRSLFYVDAEIFSRAGAVMTGLYQRSELGLCSRTAPLICVYAAAEILVTTWGTPGLGDIQNQADELAKTASAQSRLGGGFMMPLGPY